MEKRNEYIVVVGDVVTGSTFYGPFPDYNLARNYAEDTFDEWLIAEIEFVEDYYPVSKTQIMEMRLCEQNHTILKENQLYRFTVDPKCVSCTHLKILSEQK